MTLGEADLIGGHTAIGVRIPDARAMFRRALIAMVLVACLLGAVAACREPAFGWALAALMAGAGLAFGGGYVVRFASPRAIDRCSIALLVVHLLCCALWTAHGSSMQGSDFGIYFRCGVRALDPAACQSRYIDLGDLYQTRSLFYSSLLALASDSYAALKILNVTLLSSGLAVLWWAARRQLGAAAGLLALLICLLSPERWYVSTVASPDVAAQLALAVLLATFARTAEKYPFAPVLLSATAAAYVFAELHSVAPFVALALVASVMTFGRTATSHRTTLVAVLAAASLLLLSAVTHAIAPLRSADLLWGSVTGLNLADPSASPSFAWAAHMWPEIPEESRAEAGLARISAELSSHWTTLPDWLVARAHMLFSGNGYLTFATSDYSANLDTEITVRSATVPPLGALAARLATLLQLVVLAAGAVRLRANAASCVALCLVAIFLWYCLTVGEVQPRYLLLVMPAIAFTAAHAWTDAPRTELKKAAPRSYVVAALPVVAGLGVLASLGAMGSSHADTVPPTVRRDSPCGFGAHPTIAALSQGYRIEMPPTVGCVEVERMVAPGERVAMLFVTRDSFAYPRQANTPLNVDYELFVDEALVSVRSLENETAHFHRITLDGQRQHRIRLVLHRRGAVQDARAVQWLLYH